MRLEECILTASRERRSRAADELETNDRSGYGTGGWRRCNHKASTGQSLFSSTTKRVVNSRKDKVSLGLFTNRKRIFAKAKRGLVIRVISKASKRMEIFSRVVIWMKRPLFYRDIPQTDRVTRLVTHSWLPIDLYCDDRGPPPPVQRKREPDRSLDSLAYYLWGQKSDFWTDPEPIGASKRPLSPDSNCRANKS